MARRHLHAAFLLLLVLVFKGAAAVDPPAGIPRALAIERARLVSRIEYHLSFTLIQHASAAAGHERLQFDLAKQPATDLLLDFRDGSVLRLQLNGQTTDTTIRHGHLVLPANHLRRGRNEVSADFSAPVAPAAKALTAYEDKDDGSEYIYSLFVPMDASMAFPCFDQPDLKGRFRLDLRAPGGWTVVSNSKVVRAVKDGQQTDTSFAQTEVIPTYLFAFAAGHFRAIHSTAGLPTVYVRSSQVARAEAEVPAMQDIVARGSRFLSEYFAQPFPFSKYEMVLLPGFAYGGMEHAGATFLREDAMLFRSAPTDTDRFNRAITLLHELTHQWFGDFVTMRWFDDLWLKEGFAQYMAYRTMAALQPDAQVWKRFHQTIKPLAYAIDETHGTTPIYQDIPNLKDAKSAYGAIVYQKAPALLRQLEFLLGDQAFRNGLRVYLQGHRYGNAEWQDLVQAFEQVAHRDLSPWAHAWIHRRAMPVVRASWSCDQAGKLRQLILQQEDVLHEGGVWPFATEVLLGYRAQTAASLPVQVTGASAAVPQAAGKACPDYVWSNAQDHAYGVFLLDDRSRKYVSEHLPAIADTFEKTLLWGAFWDAVRFAEFSPRRYLALTRDLIGQEQDETLLQALGGRASVAVQHYSDASGRKEVVPALEAIAIGGMLHSTRPGLRIMWFRILRSIADDRTGLDALVGLLQGSLLIPEVSLRPLDRWGMVTTLLAHQDERANALFEEEKRRDPSRDGPKYAYVAEAARPDAAVKQQYFDDYLKNAARPEDWIEQSLGAFNELNQERLTQPYLRPALQALPSIKSQRKIFFVLAWLQAFLGGQNGVDSDDIVQQWLHETKVDADLRLKVLQYSDELQRTVTIRSRYP